MGFGLLTNMAISMVGASGALFGLIGGVLVWAVIDRRRAGLTLWPVAGSQLVRRTHLDGFLIEATMAVLMERRVVG